MLPFRPTPFFANKSRAFWNLQFVGWAGALLLRAVPGAINALDLSFFVLIVIETITGFSLSLILSALYRELINRRPLLTWTLSTIALTAAVLAFAAIGVWARGLTQSEGDASFTGQLISYLIYPATLLGTWSALYYAINFFLQIEEQADRLERLEAQATSAQLAMLRYQLNPHFLFNTLNSISTLVLLKQTEPANAMLTRLSSFLRHTLISQPGGKVSLAEEVETLQLYLGIERMRFEERLRTEFDIEPAAKLASLPSMLLQPLVENAIKYAVSPQEEGARISVSARLVGNRLRVTVSDTGPGLQQGRQRPSLPAAIYGDGHPVSTGVGLANIRDRLAQAYGDEHLFEIRTPPEGGFTVIIELPHDPAGVEEPAASPPRITDSSPTHSPAAHIAKRPIGTET